MDNGQAAIVNLQSAICNEDCWLGIGGSSIDNRQWTMDKPQSSICNLLSALALEQRCRCGE
jgi:hypothetical protein